MKTLAAIIGAAVLALSAGAACAQDDERPRSVAVSHADLDLSTRAGRETLNNRIDAALRRVCSRPETNHDLRMWTQQRACIAAARAGADEQVAAIYAGRAVAAIRVNAPGG